MKAPPSCRGATPALRRISPARLAAAVGLDRDALPCPPMLDTKKIITRLEIIVETSGLRQRVRLATGYISGGI